MKKLLAILAFAAALLSAAPAYAVLTIGTRTVHDQGANDDPWTFSATVASGENLAVMICHMSAITETFVGATFNSVAMAELVNNPHASAGTSSVMYSLANPSVGTFTVSVNLSATSDGSCVFIPFTDANTTLTGVTEAEGSATTTDLSVTCAVGSIAVSGGGTASLRDIYPHATQTNLFPGLIDDGNGTSFGSYEVSAGTPVSMQYRFCVAATDCTASTQSYTHVGGCVAESIQPKSGPLRRRGF